MSERSFSWSPEAELDAIRYGITVTEVVEVFESPLTKQRILRPHLLVMEGTTSTGRVLRLALDPAHMPGLYILRHVVAPS